MTLRIGLIAGVVALLFACATPAAAFDAEETFKKGTFVLSGEGAYGWQFDVEQKTRVTYLEYYDVGVRFSLLPLEPLGRDLPQQRYGVMTRGLPQSGIDAVKELPGIELPAPPQVLAEIGEQPDAIRQMIRRGSGLGSGGSRRSRTWRAGRLRWFGWCHRVSHI